MIEPVVEPWRAQLRRLWARRLAERSGPVTPGAPRDEREWGADVTLLRGLGVGLRETFAFILERGPTFDELERWVAERNGGALPPERLARLDAALRGERRDLEPGGDVFSAHDLAFFDEHGYVVLHDAVTPAQCAAAERAIWSFLGMARDEPATWYAKPHGHTIWVPFLHAPALDENRRAPRIHRAFAQLWGRDDLWPSVDQAGFNPPERPGWPFPGPHLHWDTSLATPIPLGLQGVLYLTDVTADQGAFTCVPGFHRRIDDWLASLPPDADPRAQDLDALGRVPVAGRAGDLVIWHHALPHGSSPNRADRPRIVHYIGLETSLWHREAVWK